jgi:NitT/TauT family transport system ATP-binding protein
MSQIALDRAPQASAPEEGAAVELRDVTVRFTSERGVTTALERIDLSIPRGGFLTLLGPSGCGKSTLLRVVSDLVPATSGEVRVLGTSASAARARRDIGFVFQDASLLAWRTALENVELPLEVGGGGKRRGVRDPRELLALVGLSGWEKSYPHELSGGMRQRVAIARALVNDPKLLLMDEPFGALDELTRMEMQDLLLDIRAKTGPTVMLVTHSISEAVYLSDKVAVFSTRPAKIADFIPVDLPYSRQPETRYTPEFTELEHRAGRALGITR